MVDADPKSIDVDPRKIRADREKIDNRSLSLTTISARARTSASRSGTIPQFSPAPLHHLKQHGRAAIVVPDKMIRICPAAHLLGFPSMSDAPAISIVLFEGGAGETVRGELLKQAYVDRDRPIALSFPSRASPSFICD
jgi:hypothetical protein